MTRVLLWMIVLYVLYRLFKNVRIVASKRTTNQPPPQQPPQQPPRSQQRPGQPVPFAQIQDAEFEDITPKPDEKQ